MRCNYENFDDCKNNNNKQTININQPSIKTTQILLLRVISYLAQNELSDEEGRKPEYPGETPDDKL